MATTIFKLPSSFTADNQNITGDSTIGNRIVIQASSASVSASGTGSIRFNVGNNHLEFSENGGSYTAFGSGGGGGSVSIGNSVGGGTSKSILFVDSYGDLAQDNSNFNWDGVNHRLGIGRTATTYPLEIVGDAYGTARFIINGSASSVGPSGTGAIRFNSGTNHFEFSENGGAYQALISSVSNSDSSLTISPTTGAVVASLNLGHANTFTATQTFGNHIVVDGYTLNLSSGATSSQVLQYDGSNFVAATLAFVPTSRQIHTSSGIAGGGALSSDVSLALATSGVSASTYGSATQVPVIAIDAYGRTTSASNTSIQITESQVTNLTSDLAGKVPTTTTINTSSRLTGGSSLASNISLDLATSGISANTYNYGNGSIVFDAYGRATSATASSNLVTQAYTTVDNNGTPLTQRNNLNVQPRLVATDNSGSTRTDIDLATSGVSANTYGSATQVPALTVDAYGRITSASNSSIQIAESQVTNLTTDLSGKALSSRNINTTSGQLTGGGDLSADRTLGLATTGVSAAPYGSATQVTTVTFDAYGRATTAASTSIQIAESQVTNLTSDLAAKALSATTISTTAPITGGGDLSTNRTLSIPQATTSVDGYLSHTDWTTFNSKGTVSSVATTARLTGGTITTTGTLDLAISGVTAGTYNIGNGSLAVDAYGRTTSATAPTNLVLTSRNINTAARLTGGGALSADLTLDLATSGVAANTYNYGNGSITADAYGRVTSATSASNIVTQAYTTVQNNGTGVTQESILNLSPRILASTVSSKTFIDLAVSGATAGSYTNPSITVDAYGRATSISSNTTLTATSLDSASSLSLGTGTATSVIIGNPSGGNTTIDAGSSSQINFQTGGSTLAVFTSTATFAPSTNNTGGLGNNSNSWASTYSTAVSTNFVDTITGTNLSIGSTTATSIGIGRSGITTTLTGAFTQQTGAFSLTGNSQSSITTSLGSLVLDGYANVNIGATTATGIVIGRVGQLITLPGGTIRALTPGNGGTAVNLQFGSANGGSAGGSGVPPAVGGTTTIIAGAGGNGDGYNAPAAGANLILDSGSAGTVSTFGGGANSGSIIMNIAAASGTGSSGQYSFQFAGANKAVLVSTGVFAPGTTNTGGIGNASTVWGTSFVTTTATNSVDTLTGVTLNIGSSTATGIAIGKSSITTAIVSNSINWGPGSGTTQLQLLGSVQGSVDTAGAGALIAAAGGGTASATGGGTGGAIVVRGATGGAGTGALNPGQGGGATFAGGPGGSGGTGNASGGNISVDGGLATGTGTSGTVLIGTVNSPTIVVGNSNATTYLAGLTASGTGAVRSYNKFYVTNTALATSGTTLINSPNIYLQGSYWTGSASSAYYGSLTLQMTSTSPAGYLQFLLGQPSPSEVGRIDSTGLFRVIAGGGLDTTGAGALNIGQNTATSIAVGKSGVTTTITGGLTQNTGVFSLTGNATSTITTSAGNTSVDAYGIVLVGNSTASSITIGHSGMPSGITMVTGGGGLAITGQMVQNSGSFTITGNSASSLTTSSGALTLTGAAASTWSTGAGALTLTGAGGVNIDTGASGTLNVGTTNAITLNIGNTGSSLINLNSSSVMANQKTLTGSYTNAGATANVLISLQNTQVTTTPIGAQQWSPFQEMTGHGWTYLPGVVTTNMARSAGSAPWTVTVTTGTAHGFSSGISYYLYIGDGYFPGNITYTNITVTGSTTFTYSTSLGASSGGNAVSEAINFNIFDVTGQDQAVKVKYGMRPAAGTSFANSTGAVGMASPEIVFERSSYPNNGSYGEWFKISAINALYDVPFAQTGGVSLQTKQSDGVTDGSFLTLAPAQFSLHDDNGNGFVTGPTNTIPNATGGMSLYGGGLSPATIQLGNGLGQPGAPFYDVFGIRGSYSNIGLGDVAAIRWGDQITTLSGWHSSFGLINPTGFALYGLYQLGGSAHFVAVSPPASVTVTPTGGSATSYTYLVNAIDRNGYVSGSTAGTTSSGPATRSATAYNTITWPTVVGAVSYDIYITSVSQANWIGNTATLSFKDTGAARYTSPGAGVIATPLMLTSTWSSQGGSGGTSVTYGVYAVDADNRVIASATASASFNAAASPTNYINIGWTPVGGAVGYFITNRTLSRLVGFAAQQGVAIAQGTTTSTGMSKTSGTAVVTLTYAGGHGLRVGDSVVMSAITDTTHFANGTFTVIAVTSATVFTYNDGASTTFSGTTQGTFTGPSIITSSFTDYGYPARGIGVATRNTTADVTVDGAVAATQFIVNGGFGSISGVSSGIPQLGTGSSNPSFNGADVSGTITLNTGTTPTALTASTVYALATITYGSQRQQSPNAIIISPANSAAALLVAKGISFYADSSYQSSATTWTLSMITGATGLSLTASGQINFAYWVI